jgi:RND family efflux transporter MFP subunit
MWYNRHVKCLNVIVGLLRGMDSMNARCMGKVLLALLLVLVGLSAQAEDAPEAPLPARPAESSLDFPDEFSDPGKNVAGVEAVVVNPYRSANVGSQVGGIIDRIHFDEGDLIQEGQVVVEINPTRYLLNVQRAQEKLKALEAALTRSEEESKLKAELFEVNALTRQDLIKAETEAEITLHRVGEAKRELDLAVLDLESCTVKAPFTGYLAIRYKQPGEPVERLEKIFSLVDSSRVHAVANVPESLLSQFKKGTEAIYIYSPEKQYRGVVDRVGKLIDPKSRTKRVYLLIDNSEAGLEVGMTGALRLAE